MKTLPNEELLLDPKPGTAAAAARDFGIDLTLTTFDTEIGSLDLLGEIRGVGVFADVINDAEPATMFEHEFRVLSLPKLIAAKRTAGGPKDLRMLRELEAIYEYRQSQGET